VAHTTSKIILRGLVTRTLTLEHNCGWKGQTMLVASDDKNNKYFGVDGMSNNWLVNNQFNSKQNGKYDVIKYRC
jgi:hypothetical protein